LLDERENISMTPEQLDLFIEELARFGDSLNTAMREVRRKDAR